MSVKKYLLISVVLTFVLLLIVNVTHFEEVLLDPIETEEVVLEDDKESIVYRWQGTLMFSKVDEINTHQIVLYHQPSKLKHRYQDVDTPPPEKVT